MKALKSKIDPSVNFVEEHLKGFIESRYVRRCERYFNCYLSSQTGCNKGCRFCHLTATKQTQFEDVDGWGFIEQAQSVFKHYWKEHFKAPAEAVHYSFMARGEVLANQYMLKGGDSILYELGRFAKNYGLISKFNVSTIIPKTLDRSLSDVWSYITPTIYYSLYSIREDFRKKWMPAAMPVTEALPLLRNYQMNSKKLIKIHYALIKGENDSLAETQEMLDMLDQHKLICEFNLVRYNPFSPEQGEETDEANLNTIFETIKARLGGRARIIQRVGYDVKASCGMFVE